MKNSPAGRPRGPAIKWAAAGLLLLMLLYLGQRGRQQAARQASLEDIRAYRGQLRESLEPAPAAGRGDAAPQAGELAAVLAAELERFTSRLARGGTTAAEDLEIRLGQADLANLEGRFADALSAVTEADEKTAAVAAEQAPHLGADVFTARADAHHGLGVWPGALERYQQALRLQPDRLILKGRIAECLRALQKTNEARAMEAALAAALNGRARRFFDRGRHAEALRHHAWAAQWLERLVNEGGEEEWKARLAETLGALAWIEATSPDPALRQGGRARERAQRACKLSGWQAVAPLEALAASLAETGDFSGAVRHQEQALQLAPESGRAAAGSRLALYRAGQPYRGTAP